VPAPQVQADENPPGDQVTTRAFLLPIGRDGPPGCSCPSRHTIATPLPKLHSSNTGSTEKSTRDRHLTDFPSASLRGLRDAAKHMHLVRIGAIMQASLPRPAAAPKLIRWAALYL
jgi:hypothetical protein